MNSDGRKRYLGPPDRLTQKVVSELAPGTVITFDGNHRVSETMVPVSALIRRVIAKSLDRERKKKPKEE